MVLEFDPQCGTAQSEDTLQLFVPAHQKPHPETAPRTKLSPNMNEVPEQLKMSYWPILKKFFGTTNWPKASVIIPGQYG